MPNSNEYQAAKQLVRDAPESIRDALRQFYIYHRGMFSYGEFRWCVFQYTRRETIAELESHLCMLFGKPVDGTHIKHYLQRGLVDSDWSIPSYNFQSDEFWKRHQAGIAAVSEYIKTES